MAITLTYREEPKTDSTTDATETVAPFNGVRDLRPNPAADRDASDPGMASLDKDFPSKALEESGLPFTLTK